MDYSGRVNSAAITSSELKIFLSDIYRECERNISNKNYIYETLETLMNIKWNEDVVVKYGGEIRDLVKLVDEYSSGNFRNASVNDIMFGLSLLIYYTEPTYISPTASRAMGKGVQLMVSELLLTRCEEIIKTYRLYLLANNSFIEWGRLPDREEREMRENPRELARWRREETERPQPVRQMEEEEEVGYDLTRNRRSWKDVDQDRGSQYEREQPASFGFSEFGSSSSQSDMYDRSSETKGRSRRGSQDEHQDFHEIEEDENNYNMGTFL